VLRHRKNTFGPRMAPVGLRLHFADGRVTAERFEAPPELGEARTNTHDQILAALASGPRTVAELAAALGVAPDTIAKRLREALRAGEVVHVGATDRWQLVSTARLPVREDRLVGGRGARPPRAGSRRCWQAR
jgi:DNA-binding transcriptional ArsR family regulator